MQEGYKITLDQVKKAIEDGQEVLIIINGEFYNLEKGGKK